MSAEPSPFSEAEDPELSWIDIMSPRGFGAFVTMWFLSRSRRLLLAALPFLLVAVGGTAFVAWLRSQPSDALVKRYEQEIEAHIAAEDYDEALLLLKSVSRMRPLDRRYRFQQAMLFFKADRTQDGLAEIVAISPSDDRGFPPARKWLIRQAMSEDPLLPLTDAQLLQQLLRTAEESSDDLDNQRLLAAYYLERQQYRLAEAHLQSIASEHPQLFLELAQLQQRNGRSERVVEKSYEKAENFFSQNLSRNPGSELARIGWARCLAFRGRWDEAAEILKEGLQESTDQVRKALSEVYTLKAEQLLQESIAKRSPAAVELSRALAVDSENARAIVLLSRLSHMGAEFPEGSLDPAIESLKVQLESSEDAPDSLLAMYGTVLQAAGQFEEAIATIEQMKVRNTAQRLALAKLYQRAERDEEATDIFDRLIADSRKQLEQAKDDLSLQLNLLEQLTSSGRHAQALALGEDIQVESLTAEQRRQRDRLTAISRLGIYDRLLQQTESEASKVELLKQVMSSGVFGGQALLRMAKLAFSEDSEAEEARSVVAELASSGQAPKVIHRLVGEAALVAEQPDKAVKWLERALAVEPDSPVVLNNLAYALVRSGSKDQSRALKLIDRALKAVPDQPGFLVTKAEILAASERWEETIVVLTKAQSLGSRSQTLHRLFVEAYSETGNSEAEAAHRKFLQAGENADEEAGL